MIFPGLKKLGKELGFKNNGTYFYGFINNTYVMFADGANQKNVSFRFPIRLNEDDKKKILSWKKKGYAKSIDFFDNQSFDVYVVFTEYLLPFKISKIKEVIEDITSYIKQKYPQEKSKCSGDNCTETDGLDIFDIDGIPLPMCHSCAKRLENVIENEYEDFKLQPNNYFQGSIAAAVFSIHGILVTFILFLLGRIAGASGLIYFYLTQKGYIWAKGKMNKIGVLIISLISLVYTVVGVYLSYIAVIVKEVLKLPEVNGYQIFEVIKFSFESVKEPEVKKELLTNMYLSLFLCGICILINMVQLLKSTGKVKIKNT
ncbi:MAG: hypothetical protein J6I73_03785 [Treponema sp.]|nr:hypothetical protein [Treponema sp.]